MDTWVIWNISKNKKHLTDVTNASRTFMMNLKTLKWDNEILNKFNVKVTLPQILHSSADYDWVSEEYLKNSEIYAV